MSMFIQHLFIYPVKSLGGVEVRSARLEQRGLQYDRRYMLVNEVGEFISQRAVHRMALLKVALQERFFSITATGDLGIERVEIPLYVDTGSSMRVVVWNDVCDAIHLPDFDTFFTEKLGVKCHLVYMPDSTERFIEMNYSKDGDITSFSDAYPLLIIGTASLTDLNNKLRKPLGWDRFRPNIVVKTNAAFEEDHWSQISIGDVSIDVVKPCSRCLLTTINQQTGEVGNEPLRTLSTYRVLNHKVMFGQNAIARTIGKSLHTCDLVNVR